MKYANFELKNGTTSFENSLDPAIIAKLSAMAFLGLTSFFIGILPIKLASCLNWRLSIHSHHGHAQSLPISLLLSFGGGVLLFTTFMHLQPEVREGMETIVESGILPEWLVNSGIHLSELIFCLGFFFVYLIEEIGHILLDKGHPEEELEALHRTISIRKKCKGGNLIPRIPLSQPLNQSAPSTITASTQVLIRDSNYKKNVIDPLTHKSIIPPSESGSSMDETPTKSSSVTKSITGFLAVVALSFHAVFEGLAVGLERNAANVWYLCAAIATHKLVIAFCIGVELISTKTKTLLLVLYMATFAVVSPIGIGIGLAMTFGNDSSDLRSPEIALASVVLQGLASGTLLYVVFFEVLQREKSGRHGMVEFLSIIAGFLVMVCLSIFVGGHHHHHAHEHGHSHQHVHHAHEELLDLKDT